MNEEIIKQAKELVEKYYNAMNPNRPDCNISWRQAKQCALIACDARIDECNNYDRTDGYVQQRIDYQLAVKQAIENL